MNRYISICIILIISFTFHAFSESTKISYYVGDELYEMNVDLNSEEINIVNSTDTDISSKRKYSSVFKSVKGLEKLKKLQTVCLRYFDTIENIDLDQSTVNTLIIQFSKENNESIKKYYNQRLKALVFQSCSFDSTPVIDIGNNYLEYLEFSNCYLKNLPILQGRFKYINLIYNKISSISETEWKLYQNIPTVLLQGNNLTVSPGSNAFIAGSYGEVNKLLPMVYSRLAQ